MKWDELETRWTELAGLARVRWIKLTDDDWGALAGKKGHLIGRIQKRYEIAREEAERQVDEWSEALPDTVPAPKTP
jgi:uncharacterized protein YjbJ (UPF0337 family)